MKVRIETIYVPDYSSQGIKAYLQSVDIKNNTVTFNDALGTTLVIDIHLFNKYNHCKIILNNSIPPIPVFGTLWLFKHLGSNSGVECYLSRYTENTMTLDNVIAQRVTIQYNDNWVLYDLNHNKEIECHINRFTGSTITIRTYGNDASITTYELTRFIFLRRLSDHHFDQKPTVVSSTFVRPYIVSTIVKSISTKESPAVGQKWYIRFTNSMAPNKLDSYTISTLTEKVVGFKDKFYSDINYYKLTDIEFVEQIIRIKND